MLTSRDKGSAYTPSDLALAAWSAQLESARCLIETKFLAVGEVLAEAVEGIGSMIDALDAITEAVNPAIVGSTQRNLDIAATTLLALPAKQLRRRAVVAALAEHRSDLAAHLIDIRLCLAYMRAFTVNIKITAGGIASAGAAFGLFAEEIASQIDAGRDEVDGLDNEIAALQRTLFAAAAQDAGLASHCADLIPAVPHELTASARLMGDQHQRIAVAAAKASALAREVRKKVARTLAGLQIGDITRQRIEHIQVGLDLLAGLDVTLPVEQCAEIGIRMRLLLAAQLTDTCADFGREVTQIANSMAGLTTDSAALLHLRDVAYGNGSGRADGFLLGLERRIEQAAGLVGEIEAVDRAAQQMGDAVGRAAQILSARLAAVQTMKGDVQCMALNASLKSTRIGEPGRPLKTIAAELELHAGNLESTANECVQALSHLSGAATALTQEDSATASADGTACDASVALDNASQRIREARSKTEADFGDLAAQGEAVVALLKRSAERFDIQAEIGGVLDVVATEMAIGCAPNRSMAVGAPLACMIETLATHYTMSRERVVQQGVVEAWTASATSAL